MTNDFGDENRNFFTALRSLVWSQLGRFARTTEHPFRPVASPPTGTRDPRDPRIVCDRMHMT